MSRFSTFTYWSSLLANGAFILRSVAGSVVVSFGALTVIPLWAEPLSCCSAHTAEERRRKKKKRKRVYASPSADERRKVIQLLSDEQTHLKGSGGTGSRWPTGGSLTGLDLSGRRTGFLIWFPLEMSQRADVKESDPKRRMITTGVTKLSSPLWFYSLILRDWVIIPELFKAHRVSNNLIFILLLNLDWWSHSFNQSWFNLHLVLITPEMSGFHDL